MSEKPAIEYRYDIENNYAKIYMNNLLHLSFRMDEFLAMQAYKLRNKWYCVEIYLKGRNTILCEYNQKEKWISIVNLLNDIVT